MSASASFYLERQSSNSALSPLRQAARNQVKDFRDRKQQRQHLIADLRGKIAQQRRAMEQSEIEQRYFQPLYQNLLEQLVLLDELERNN